MLTRIYKGFDRVLFVDHLSAPTEINLHVEKVTVGCFPNEASKLHKLLSA